MPTTLATSTQRVESVRVDVAHTGRSGHMHVSLLDGDLAIIDLRNQRCMSGLSPRDGLDLIAAIAEALGVTAQLSSPVGTCIVCGTATDGARCDKGCSAVTR